MSHSKKRHIKRNNWSRRRKIKPFAMEKPKQQPLLIADLSGESASCMGFSQIKRARKQQRRERQVQNKAARQFHKKETLKELSSCGEE